MQLHRIQEFIKKTSISITGFTVPKPANMKIAQPLYKRHFTKSHME
jgi:hypothetical protein